MQQDEWKVVSDIFTEITVEFVAGILLFLVVVVIFFLRGKDSMKPRIFKHRRELKVQIQGENPNMHFLF